MHPMHLSLHSLIGESPLTLCLVTKKGVTMDEKKQEINRTLSAVLAMIHLLFKVHILTNRHVKTMLKSIETDKEPLAILKELKDIAGTVDDK